MSEHEIKIEKGGRYLIRERKFRSAMSDILCLDEGENAYLIRWCRSGHEEWKEKDFFDTRYRVVEKLKR